MSLIFGANNTFSQDILKASTDETFFTGGHNDQMPVDPFISGHAFFFWTKLPAWFEKKFEGFKDLSEKNLRAFQGITSLELTTAGIQQGFSTTEAMYAAGIQKPQGFSLTHREWQGLPFTNAYTYWVSSIRDPNTNVATYPKREGIPYASRNHTGEGIYIVTTPDADNVDGRIVQYAQYFTGVMPTKIPRDHLNYTAGTNDMPEIEQTFTGQHHTSPQVDAMAAKILKEQYRFRHEFEFDSKSFEG